MASGRVSMAGPVEVYEKRPPRRRAAGNQRREVSEEARVCLYAVQRGVCPGCGIHLPHYLRFEADHILALSDDGDHEVRNWQLLCSYCNRVKGTQGQDGFRMKMPELRGHNIRSRVMVDEQLAVLTGRRLAQYHREVVRAPTGGVRAPAGGGPSSADTERV